LGDLYTELDHKQQALSNYKKGIVALGPEPEPCSTLERAYTSMAFIHKDLQQNEEAFKYLAMGLKAS